MNTYCVFNIGDRRVGLPMTCVREILEKDFVTPAPIPLTPGFMHGLFNLRGQVMPLIDLSEFIGAAPMKTVNGTERAVIVERGALRFATIGHRIDTLDAADETLQPIGSAALFPALEAEAQTARGNFQIIHLDRLEACLKQSMKITEAAEASSAARSETSPIDIAIPT